MKLSELKEVVEQLKELESPNISHLRTLSNELIIKNPNGGMYLSPQLVKQLLDKLEQLELQLKNIEDCTIR